MAIPHSSPRRPRGPLPAALLLALLGSQLLGCRAPAPETVVLVTLDTRHVRATTPYEPDLETTPNLSRFAAEGVLFRSVWSQVPLTVPSHASILSGLEPPRHAAFLNGDRLPEEILTLPEILRDNGFTTAAFTSLGVLKPGFNLDQGFDHYESLPGATDGRWYRTADQVFAAVESWWSSRPPGPVFLWVHLSDPHAPYLPPDAPPDVELRLDGEVVGRYLLASQARNNPVIELPPGEHVLSWVPIRERWPGESPATRLRFVLLAPDRLEPYLGAGSRAPEREIDLAEPLTLELVNDGEKPERIRLPFSGSLDWPSKLEVQQSYLSEVEYADRYLGELRELISPELDGALWILASDHGEGLYHHGVVGHAVYVFEDQLRALWMLAGGGVPRGVAVEERGILLTDVTPTVLDLLGLPIPDGLDGVSQVGCWGRGDCGGRSSWWAYGADLDGRRLTGLALFAPPFKCVWQLSPGSGCFDIVADPWESENLAIAYTEDPASMPERVGRMAEEIERRRESLQEALAAGPGPQPEHLQMLRDLGYLN